MNPERRLTASRNQQLRSLLLGGILPVIAFTVIEEYFGTLWGLVAGMVFGAGEILYEWRKNGRVENLTWGGNGLILVLGAVSLFTKEGVWFKLQPAILEAVTGGILLGSVLLGKSVLLLMAKKQGVFENMAPDISQQVVPVMERGMNGLTIRLSIFFWLHAVLATWAALYASTTVWALLKGVGFTVSMIVYMVVESLFLRYRIATTIRKAKQASF